MKNQAKRMKQTYDAQTPENRRAFKKKEELNALLAEAVRSVLTTNGKRKGRGANNAQGDIKKEKEIE